MWNAYVTTADYGEFNKIMPSKTTFLYSLPRKSISEKIICKAINAIDIYIITGFLTCKGIKNIIQPIKKNPDILKSMVIGCASSKGCEALEYLNKIGVPSSRLRVHLGFIDDTKPEGKAHHPMMHSKIVYMTLPKNKACAFIGSHNITSFAMEGENAEASILIEGSIKDENLKKIKRHINIITKQSDAYREKDRLFFEKYSKRSINGFTNDIFNDYDPRTLLIFATSNQSNIFFNTPLSIKLSKDKFKKIQGTEVHIYIFDQLPIKPEEAFHKRDQAKYKYKGKVVDTNSPQREGELKTSYCIKYENNKPIIIKSGKQLLSSNNQLNSYIIEVNDKIKHKYKYDVSDGDSKKYDLVKERASEKEKYVLVSAIKRKEKERLLFNYEDKYEYVMLSYYKEINTD